MKWRMPLKFRGLLTPPRSENPAHSSRFVRMMWLAGNPFESRVDQYMKWRR